MISEDRGFLSLWAAHGKSHSIPYIQKKGNISTLEISNSIS